MLHVISTRYVAHDCTRATWAYVLETVLKLHLWMRLLLLLLLLYFTGVLGIELTTSCIGQLARSCLNCFATGLAICCLSSPSPYQTGYMLPFIPQSISDWLYVTFHPSVHIRLAICYLSSLSPYQTGQLSRLDGFWAHSYVLEFFSKLNFTAKVFVLWTSIRQSEAIKSGCICLNLMWSLFC